MFSKACEYGIRAAIFITLASKQDERVNLKAIAKAINSPEAFTAKILQQLSRNKIIESITGPTGGFIIRKEKMNKIKLSHIVSAIDGNSIYKGCGLGLKECSEKRPCPVHNKFKIVRGNLSDMLESTSLDELSLGLKEGITFLKK